MGSRRKIAVVAVQSREILPACLAKSLPFLGLRTRVVLIATARLMINAINIRVVGTVLAHVHRKGPFLRDVRGLVAVHAAVAADLRCLKGRESLRADRTRALQDVQNVANPVAGRVRAGLLIRVLRDIGLNALPGRTIVQDHVLGVDRVELESLGLARGAIDLTKNLIHIRIRRHC